MDGPSSPTISEVGFSKPTVGFEPTTPYTHPPTSINYSRTGRDPGSDTTETRPKTLRTACFGRFISHKGVFSTRCLAITPILPKLTHCGGDLLFWSKSPGLAQLNLEAKICDIKKMYKNMRIVLTEPTSAPIINKTFLWFR